MKAPYTKEAAADSVTSVAAIHYTTSHVPTTFQLMQGFLPRACLM